MESDTNSYSDEEDHAEFDRLFPYGFAGRDVLPRQQKRSHINPMSERGSDEISPQRANAGSEAIPSLARWFSLLQHPELPCRGNTDDEV